MEPLATFKPVGKSSTGRVRGISGVCSVTCIDWGGIKSKGPLDLLYYPYTKTAFAVMIFSAHNARNRKKPSHSPSQMKFSSRIWRILFLASKARGPSVAAMSS